MIDVSAVQVLCVLVFTSTLITTPLLLNILAKLDRAERDRDAEQRYRERFRIHSRN